MSLAIAGLIGALSVWPLNPQIPAPESLAPPTVAPAAAPAETLAMQAQTDPAEVFRRAFWREPTAEDRIVHAERREWTNAADGVRRWEWFLAVEPGAEFSAWLREQNPFAVATIDPAAFAPPHSAPAWFPAPPALARCEIRQTANRGLTLLFDPTENLLYATDAGHGFAIARRARESAASPAAADRESALQPGPESPRHFPPAR